MDSFLQPTSWDQLLQLFYSIVPKLPWHTEVEYCLSHFSYILLIQNNCALIICTPNVLYFSLFPITDDLPFLKQPAIYFHDFIDWLIDFCYSTEHGMNRNIGSVQKNALLKILSLPLHQWLISYNHLYQKVWGLRNPSHIHARMLIDTLLFN